MEYSIKSLLLLLLLGVGFCSCDKKEKRKTSYEIEREIQKRIDTFNQTQATKLIEKQNAIVGWDSLNQYTYLLQELFESGNRPISFIGDIRDIIIKDSGYVLKLSNYSTTNYKTCIAEVSLSNITFLELKKQLKIGNDETGCFIFKVNRVSSHFPMLSTEVESDGPNVEDARSYLTYDFNDMLIKIEGVLIDYYLYKRPEEE